MFYLNVYDLKMAEVRIFKGVTHKRWDCKDDLDYQNMTISGWIKSYALKYGLLRAEKWNLSTVANRPCNRVQSSLKSHPLWVTLYNALFLKFTGSFFANILCVFIIAKQELLRRYITSILVEVKGYPSNTHIINNILILWNFQNICLKLMKTGMKNRVLWKGKYYLFMSLKWVLLVQKSFCRDFYLIENKLEK